MTTILLRCWVIGWAICLFNEALDDEHFRYDLIYLLCAIFMWPFILISQIKEWFYDRNS